MMFFTNNRIIIFTCRADFMKVETVTNNRLVEFVGRRIPLTHWYAGIFTVYSEGQKLGYAFYCGVNPRLRKEVVDAVVDETEEYRQK